MTQLTKNFTLEEFLIKQTEKPNEEIKKNLKSVATVLQAYRDTVFKNAPITIHSGWRSPSYNANILGASKNSYHCRGLAVDFAVKGWTKEQIYQTMDKVHFGGVEYYLQNGWTICHIDLRGSNCRFDSNNKILKCNYNIDEHNKIFHPAK